MGQRNMPAVLLAAGAAAGVTLTYLTRTTRARLRKGVTQAVTVFAPRSRVEEFVESREHMIEVLGNRKMMDNVARLEVREAPGERGTEIYLTMRGVGKYATKDILRRAKALLEAGELPTGRRFAT